MCEGIICRYGAACENGVCACPITCNAVRNASCGSDGRTYVNECDLRKRSCAQEVDIKVAHIGECEKNIAVVVSGSGKYKQLQVYLK